MLVKLYNPNLGIYKLTKLVSMVITTLPATRCHCMYVCAAVIVEKNKKTNKQKNTHRHVELLMTS